MILQCVHFSMHWLDGLVWLVDLFISNSIYLRIIQNTLCLCTVSVQPYFVKRHPNGSWEQVFLCFMNSLSITFPHICLDNATFRKVLTTIVQVVFLQVNSSQIIIAELTLNYSIWADFMVLFRIFLKNFLIAFLVLARKHLHTNNWEMLIHTSSFIFMWEACPFIATVNFKVIPFCVSL